MTPDDFRAYVTTLRAERDAAVRERAEVVRAWSDAQALIATLQHHLEAWLGGQLPPAWPREVGSVEREARLIALAAWLRALSREDRLRLKQILNRKETARP